MKCEYCNGTGEIINDALRWTSCPACGGKGYIKQTNDEWFDGLSTEEKARFFSHEMRCEFCPNQEQCDALGVNCKVLWEKWLKQLHKGD